MKIEISWDKFEEYPEKLKKSFQRSDFTNTLYLDSEDVGESDVRDYIIPYLIKNGSVSSIIINFSEPGRDGDKSAWEIEEFWRSRSYWIYKLTKIQSIKLVTTKTIP